jgi:hypothetical protein
MYNKHKDSILSSFFVAVLSGQAIEAIGCLPLPVLIDQQYLTVIDTSRLGFRCFKEIV